MYLKIFNKFSILYLFLFSINFNLFQLAQNKKEDDGFAICKAELKL